MYPNLRSGITIAKVLSSVNKSLNIAKEIIPIYQSISPMIGNARRAFSLLKEFKGFNLGTPQNSSLTSNDTPLKKTTNSVSSNSSYPSFFQ